MRRFFYNWLPVGLWLIVIMVNSTDMMSAEHTGTILQAILTPLFGEVPPRRFDLIHFVIRKSGHLFEYAMLSLLLFRGLRLTFLGPARRWAGIAIAFTATVAWADEFHQSFVPSRGGGDIKDVMLDTTGAILMMMLVLASRRLLQCRPTS
jgi:VanZ family protein